MKMNFLFVLFLSSLVQAGQPPVAPKVPHEISLHGDTRLDNYYWMLAYPGDEHSKLFDDYLNAENEYTDAQTKHLEGFRSKLLKEMIARSAETDLSVPEKIGDYLYYSKTEKGKDYPSLMRKSARGGGREEIVLDCNVLAQGHDYYDLTGYEVSPDQKNLLYMEYYAGGVRALFLKNFESGQTRKVRENDLSYAGFDWAPDSQAIFYSVQDQAQRPYRVYREDLRGSQPVLLFEETDPVFELGSVKRTADGRYLLIETESKSTNETLYLDLLTSQHEPRLFAPRKTGHQYSVEHNGDYFFILSNKDGVNYGLYATLDQETGIENWRTVQAPGEARSLDGFRMFKSFMVLMLRENGLTKIETFKFPISKPKAIAFDEPFYVLEVNEGTNLDYAATSFHFNYTSLTVPGRVYSFDPVRGTKTVLKDKKVGGGFNAQNYKVERVFVAVRDGVKVPVSIIYKKGVKLDGNAPLFLNAYGNYGSPFFIEWVQSYSVASISPLLDRGVIYAIAHVRGGGEMGPKWYFDGKLQKKKNTFQDFIDVTEWLIANKYTRSSRLGIRSLSAGGLLLGFVTNNRPDLYKAVIAHSPFVDLLTTMTDEKIPLTTQEWEEWGNPNIEPEYAYMRSYCPVSNVGHHDYPNMLVKTAYKDMQVMVHEPAKWVAKIRDQKTDDNELLLKVNMKGGHGGDSGQYAELEEVSFDLAWLLEKLGVTSE